MVVRERMRHDLEARLGELAEESSRVADAGDCVHLLPGESLQWLPVAGVAHAMKGIAFQLQVLDDLVDCSQSPTRFTHRAGGEQEAVSEAADHGDLEVAPQA